MKAILVNIAHQLQTVKAWGQLDSKMYYKLLPLSQTDCPTFRIFCPKMIICFICSGRNLRLKVKYFCTKLSISRSLSTPQLLGAFWSSCLYIFQKSYLQLHGQWLAGLNLAKVRNTYNHLRTEGVQFRDFIWSWHTRESCGPHPYGLNRINLLDLHKIIQNLYFLSRRNSSSKMNENCLIFDIIG